MIRVQALAFEPFMPRLRARSVLQQDQIGQLRRVDERGSGQARWRAHRHQRFAEQLQGFGAGAGALAEVERQVTAPLQQLIGFLLIAYIQMNLWMSQTPAFKAWDKPASAEGRGCRDTQDLCFPAVGTQRVRRHLHLGQDFSDFYKVQIPGWRQL